MTTGHMTPTQRMKFGAFMAPFHRVGENPTLALDRDLASIQWLDELGYDEAYAGEHRSAGWETIGSPEVVYRNRRRTHPPHPSGHRRGQPGVAPPLHGRQPQVLLNHPIKGRVILGVGPGALTSDAVMLSIDPAFQREMMDESLEVIIHLFTETEPVSHKSNWFELNEAALQLRPYQQSHIPITVASARSPAGPTLAVRDRASILSLNAPRETVRRTNLQELWTITKETPAEHGKMVRQVDWQPCHITENR